MFQVYAPHKTLMHEEHQSFAVQLTRNMRYSAISHDAQLKWGLKVILAKPECVFWDSWFGVNVQFKPHWYVKHLPPPTPPPSHTKVILQVDGWVRYLDCTLEYNSYHESPWKGIKALEASCCLIIVATWSRGRTLKLQIYIFKAQTKFINKTTFILTYSQIWSCLMIKRQTKIQRRNLKPLYLAFIPDFCLTFWPLQHYHPHNIRKYSAPQVHSVGEKKNCGTKCNRLGFVSAKMWASEVFIHSHTHCLSLIGSPWSLKRPLSQIHIRTTTIGVFRWAKPDWSGWFKCFSDEDQNFFLQSILSVVNLDDNSASKCVVGGSLGLLSLIASCFCECRRRMRLKNE